jgi:hypothetical protein
MASLADLMSAVRNLRDTLHDRLDDNVTDEVFRAIRLRHAQAVIQARREAEDPSLPSASDMYDSVIAALNTARNAVSSAEDTDAKAMLDACEEARLALNMVKALPPPAPPVT